MTGSTQDGLVDRIIQFAGPIARWILGGLFIYMGLIKALHPADFLTLLRQFNLVDGPPILNGIAATLPWFEIFCGILLVTGVAVRGAALVVLAMLVPFTLVVWHRAFAMKTAMNVPFCAIHF